MTTIKHYQCRGYLYIIYEIIKKSRNEIAKECNVSGPTILTWMIKYNIPRRTISQALKGRIITEEWKNKISKTKTGIPSELHPWFGRKHSKETIEKLSGENNCRWRGNDAGYKAIHQWVRKYKPKTDNCEFCGKNKKLVLSSKTHKYTRNLDEYLWLCNTCHRNFDINFPKISCYNKLNEKLN